MPYIKIYGFILVGIMAALGLAWLMDSGLIWAILGAIALFLIWFGRQCWGIDRQLQSLKQAGKAILKAMAVRGRLADQLFEAAVRFDQGDRLAGVAYGDVDRPVWMDRSVQVMDEAVRTGLVLMEKEAMVGEQPAFLKQKQRLLEAQGTIHECCGQFNRLVQGYDEARQQIPAVWFEGVLGFPLAPAITVTDGEMVLVIQQFERAESPFWRDVLTAIGQLGAFASERIQRSRKQDLPIKEQSELGDTE